MGGKETEQSKSEDLQDESIAYIAFEEEHRSLLFFNIFCMRIFRIVSVTLLWCIIAILPICKVYSQDNDTVLMLDSLLVTGQRSESSVAAAQQSLSADRLERIGAINVGDALKHLSGVTVKDYGGVGGMKSVSIRGMGAHHTAVFYDGVAIGDCQSGQIDVGRFSTDNLSMLHLTIGQVDDIYQSARMFASAGSVAIETKIPYTNMLKIGASAGSFNSYKGYIHGACMLGNMWRASLFTDYTSTAGDYSFSIPNGHKQLKAKRNNSDADIMRMEINAAWEQEKHSLRAKLYSYYSDRGLPGAVIVDNPLSSERLESANLFGQLFYEYLPSSALRMKATFKHNYTYDRHLQPRPAGSVAEFCYNQQESDLSYTLKWTPRRLTGASFAFSEELFYNRLCTNNSNSTMPSLPQRLTSLSVLSGRYTNRWLTATASLLFTFVDDWVATGYEAPVRKRFSPSFAVAFTPLGESLAIRASYKDIFRLPTFNDLYYRDFGNYKLLPEKSRMANIGLSYKVAAGRCLENLLISADAYYGWVEDKIVATPGVFVWKMSNVDDVSLCGIDANASLGLRFCDAVKLAASAAYSYMRAVNATAVSPLKGHQIIYTPRHSGSLSAELQTPYLSAGYNLIWSGNRYRLPQNIESNIVDGYFDHSLWLSREWKIYSSALITKLEVLNVGCDTYEIVRYYPMPGCNWRISLNYKL